MTPKISLIHPTRGRAQQAANTFINWLSKSKNIFDIEYVFSLDNDDDSFLELYRWLDKSTINKQWEGARFLRNDNSSAIEAINHGAVGCSGDIIIQIADDFDCPLHWDEILLTALEGKSDYLVKTQDGLQPFLITLPIMDRAYYNRFGYIYNPSYKHMFCDTEMTAIGHMLDRVITLPLIFTHNHYTTGKSPKDAISIKNDSTWVQGETLYNQRKAINFGLTKEQIVKPFPAQFL